MIVRSLTDKRLIVAVKINGKSANMLVDTGASMSLVDDNQSGKYGYERRNKLSGTITGVGGEQSDVWHVKDIDVKLQGLPVYQFLMTDLSGVASSIQEETGIDIAGIIGLPQIKDLEMKIDADNNLIKLGY